MGRASRRKRNGARPPIPQSARAARSKLLDEALAAAARDAKGLVAPPVYRARLTPEQARAGMDVAFANARRLLADAETLLDAGSPTAVAIAILALEEAAKIPILRAIVDCTTADGVARRWNDYTDHRAKVAAVNAPYGDPDGSVGHRMRAIAQLKGLSDQFEVLKEMALYSAAIDEDRITWHAPKTFPIDTVSAVVEMARLVLVGRRYDAKEAALWQRFVVPAVDKATGDFCAAVAKFEREAVRQRLRDVTDPDELALMRARQF